MVRLRDIPALARAILDDRDTRRKWLLGMTAVLVVGFFLGAVPFAAWLEERPWLFIGFWIACAWLTITVLVLALFDMVLVVREGRRERRELRRKIFGRPPEDGPPR